MRVPVAARPGCLPKPNRNRYTSFTFYFTYWQRCPVSDHGRTIPGMVKGKKIMRVYISDGRHEPLVGKCVFFMREKRDEITSHNVMVCRLFQSPPALAILRP